MTVSEVKDILRIFYAQNFGKDYHVVEPLLLKWINNASEIFYRNNGKLTDIYTLNTVGGTQSYSLTIPSGTYNKVGYNVRQVIYDGYSIYANEIKHSDMIDEDRGDSKVYWAVKDGYIYFKPTPDSTVEVSLDIQWYPEYNTDTTSLVRSEDIQPIINYCYFLMASFLGKPQLAAQYYSLYKQVALDATTGTERQERRSFRLYDW